VVHSATILTAMGTSPADPTFLAERRRHVIDLVLKGMQSQLAEPLTFTTTAP
jgi:hypothetical protein